MQTETPLHVHVKFSANLHNACYLINFEVKLAISVAIVNKIPAIEKRRVKPSIYAAVQSNVQRTSYNCQHDELHLVTDQIQWLWSEQASGRISSTYQAF